MCPADNHKAFLESMAPTFKPYGNAQYAAGRPRLGPTEVEQFAGVVRRLAQKHGMPTRPTISSMRRPGDRGQLQ